METQAKLISTLLNYSTANSHLEHLYLCFIPNKLSFELTQYTSPPQETERIC